MSSPSSSAPASPPRHRGRLRGGLGKYLLGRGIADLVPSIPAGTTERADDDDLDHSLAHISSSEVKPVTSRKGKPEKASSGAGNESGARFPPQICPQASDPIPSPLQLKQHRPQASAYFAELQSFNSFNGTHPTRSEFNQPSLRFGAGPFSVALVRAALKSCFRAKFEKLRRSSVPARRPHPSSSASIAAA
ncbi:hypothetical protein MVEN_00459700 [Mycena venus]|uniref:Uncharacterized protein n=1 Tax=Mycena venus TaxID=2733690 RepID=A0A8H6YRD9_9AGAR|nr:hypothetical protein MVEN_00459700 [Mycena venus]